MPAGQRLQRRRLDGPARPEQLGDRLVELLPGWAEDPAVRYRLINARSESASAKPSFRAAFRSRRCLIPASGFYEWHRTRTARQPYLISRVDGQPMAFAGLWERWTVPRGMTLTRPLATFEPGEDIETCTILTTDANATMHALHHRMPVILSDETFGPWLTGEEVPLGPAPDDFLATHRVTPRVNSPRNDDPECIVALGTD